MVRMLVTPQFFDIPVSSFTNGKFFGFRLYIPSTTTSLQLGCIIVGLRWTRCNGQEAVVLWVHLFGCYDV